VSSCSNCGTAVEETSLSCGNCGTRIEPPPTVDLAQKYLGVGVYAVLCLFFLPVGGFILTSLVAFLMSVIFHPSAKLMNDLYASPTFAFPIVVGLASGFYLNRKNVHLADLFAWFLSTAWFAWYFYTEGPSQFRSLFSPPGPSCDECLEKVIFPIPLFFSFAYSAAALSQKLRMKFAKSRVTNYS
jgi:hypothetical protein